jgi:secondary thiamine-phosphate synthase enzyme
MRFHCEHLSIRTTAPIELIDITARIRDLFQQHPVRHGQITVFSAHTTAFVALNENEPNLQRDMLDFLKELVPSDRAYGHNAEPIDGRLNAHSHLLGLFMNASETIPVSDGQLLLGHWQSVFFVELDGPRDERQLRVQFVGEF